MLPSGGGITSRPWSDVWGIPKWSLGSSPPSQGPEITVGKDALEPLLISVICVVNTVADICSSTTEPAKVKCSHVVGYVEQLPAKQVIIKLYSSR